jgi:hypothetical protein
MCNELYEQIRQVAQRSAERVVDLLCAGVGRDLGGQARQKRENALDPEIERRVDRRMWLHVSQEYYLLL